MDRAAQRRRADDVTIEQQRVELPRREALEARPESDVRIGGHLRLQTDEMLDGCECVERRTLQEQLTGERGAVQPTIADHLHARRAYAQALLGRRGPTSRMTCR